HSSSSSTLTNNVGRALATSVVQNVNIGGVIKIKSVTSTATAQTDGAKADASGGTVVQGMEIAGQPAYVDDSGVHVGKQGQPANAVAAQIVNQALTNFGMKIYVSQPIRTINGSSAEFNAGSVYFYWAPPDAPPSFPPPFNPPKHNVFTMSVGGARVGVAGAPGSDYGGASDVPLPSLAAP